MSHPKPARDPLVGYVRSSRPRYPRRMTRRTTPSAYLDQPCDQWPPAATFAEVAQQEAIRSARAQGLPDRISDQATVSRLAALLTAGSRR